MGETVLLIKFTEVTVKPAVNSFRVEFACSKFVRLSLRDTLWLYLAKAVALQAKK